ncbi:hypothetical protein [Rhizobium ruizarguesonis]|uniref:hypothetical protein n=1 Tax=Rhizobium ruizarguesonis TaxID=2081791 RepID=UPI0010301888|nr:hypothetical protein [Rhizobium ruizarguesonis]TAW61577.1 hypothetical protein ELI16_33555 [Rhizobium ruizarguesonis]
MLHVGREVDETVTGSRRGRAGDRRLEIGLLGHCINLHGVDQRRRGRDAFGGGGLQGGSLEHHINDLPRFYMDTNVFREQEFRETWEGRGAVLPEP